MLSQLIRIVLLRLLLLPSVAGLSKAQAPPLLGLPEPGTLVSLSSAYQPAIIKGLTIHKDNPFLFDFFVDVGQVITLRKPF